MYTTGEALWRHLSDNDFQLKTKLSRKRASERIPPWSSAVQSGSVRCKLLLARRVLVRVCRLQIDSKTANKPAPNSVPLTVAERRGLDDRSLRSFQKKSYTSNEASTAKASRTFSPCASCARVSVHTVGNTILWCGESL